MNQTLPIGTIEIDDGLRRFALDHSFPAEHCVASPPDYSTAICNTVDSVHLLAEFIRLYFSGPEVPPGGFRHSRVSS